MVYEQEILIELKKLNALISGMYNVKEVSEVIAATSEAKTKEEILLK